jgi:hypothetical protein
MKKNKLLSFDFFPSFQNRDNYYEKITCETPSIKGIITLYLLLCLFSFLYGIIMGSYHSFIQAVSSGIKVCFLFTMVLLVCFPAFFVIQLILGSRLRLIQMVLIFLSGFLLITIIMVAFSPIAIFFMITGSNYYFLQLLHIVIFLFAGFFGMKTIIDALVFSCEKKNIYPKTGLNVFRFWAVILAFVGIQLAWNLRPFLGDRNQPFKVFRQYEGNFYEAIIYSVKQLTLTGDEKKIRYDEKAVNHKNMITDDAYKRPFEDK